jgi:hypothetical protein
MSVKAGHFIVKTWNRILDFWFGAMPVERLQLWKRVFALSFLYYTLSWGQYAREWLTDYGYHVSERATNPVFPAPFPVLPDEWLVPFLGLMWLSTLLVVLNIGGRITTALCLSCAVYIQFADQTSSFTLNKLYILGFFLFTVASRAKRVTAVGQDGVERTGLHHSAWTVRTMQATLIIQYTDAGICKLAHGDWLKHADILFGHSVGLYRTEIAGLAIHYMPHFFWIVSSIFAVSFETLAAPLFMIRRLRRLALVSGIGMHLGIQILMKDLVFFSFQMITFYFLFFNEEFVVHTEHKIQRWLQGLWSKLTGPSKAIPSSQDG